MACKESPAPLQTVTHPLAWCVRNKSLRDGPGRYWGDDPCPEVSPPRKVGVQQSSPLREDYLSESHYLGHGGIMQTSGCPSQEDSLVQF